MRARTLSGSPFLVTRAKWWQFGKLDPKLKLLIKTDVTMLSIVCAVAAAQAATTTTVTVGDKDGNCVQFDLSTLPTQTFTG